MDASITHASLWLRLARHGAALAIAGFAVIAGCGGDDTIGVTANDASADVTTADAPSSCPNGQSSCADGCANLTTDATNCGTCGTQCTAGMVCSQGVCALSCGGGTTQCGSSCVETKLDPSNCGACGTKCAADMVCSNGTCASGCTGNLTTCGGGDAGARYCANTSGTDGANCGSCGHTCGAGTACNNGTCGTTCGGGEALCAPDGGAAYCANFQTDPANCGSCGAICAAGMACSATGCVVACPGGQLNCGGSCVDPKTSPLHCGATAGCGAGDTGSAGTACASGTACSNGTCTVSCPGTQINCNGSCVDPQSNAQFCGATAGCGVSDAGSPGTACANGTACVSGACSVSCPGTQINCNGSCIDPQTNAQFCGATAGCGANDAGSPGTACANGMACASGACSVSCPGTQINCNGSCIDPQTNAQFCGATAGCGANDAGSPGTACANGMACASGACSVSCPGSQINCNGSCVDPTTNNQYCGATTGCGADDAGSPGTTCGDGTVCKNSVCSATCASPLVDCSGTCVDENDDPQHCGSCSACPAVANASSPVCRSKTCVTGICAAGFADCNGTYSDGCEVSTGSDKNNCGACGNVCPVSLPFCTSGACTCAPPPCTTGTDPETSAPWVVCTSDCTQAWLSANNFGQYHALQICNNLGYSSVGGWAGTSGTVCGTNQGAGSCSSPGTPSFSIPISNPDFGTDAHGPIIANTVEWQCLH